MDFRGLQLKIKKYFPVWGVYMIFSCALYAMLMLQQLVNSYDGLWEYSYYTAGGWELSLGRWFWLYLDQLRMGISTDPLTSLITLGLFSVGMLVVLDLFEIDDKKNSYIVGFLFLSNAIVCVSLSYRYMSPTFGVAFLLSVLSAWFMIKVKNHIISIIFGTGFLAFSIGAYQAYIGCACIVILGYLLQELLNKGKSVKDILVLVTRCLVSGILGVSAYIVILQIHLKIFHVAMSSYNGANSYSFGNTISQLFSSLKKAYEVFALYFGGSYFISNILQQYKIFLICFVVIGILLCYTLLDVFKNNILKGILFLVFCLLIPVACGAILLGATDSAISIQMTAPWGMCIPILWCIVSKIRWEDKVARTIKAVAILIVSLVLYGNIYQVILDQNAMSEGKIATVTMANNIINDLAEEGCLNSEVEYCVLGIPAGNGLFSVSDLYAKANSYAKFGVWWSEPSCTRRSWSGVFHYLCGTNLNITSVSTYGAILADEEVRKMPKYPEEGYICQKDNVVIIKVADY